MLEQIDREADANALRALADWMVRASPHVAMDGPDGLMLETTGCAHLFGGEAGMAAMLFERFKAVGYGHRLAFAGTPGAAHALAHAGDDTAGPVILPPGAEREGLAPLPVSALRLSADTLTLLRRFGLTRIGQLYGIDRKALARRFNSREASSAVCLRLDQALGIRAEPLVPLRPAADHSARLACPEPLATLDGIGEGLRQLAERLCADLSAYGLGARDFILIAFRSDGGVSDAAIHAAQPVCSPEHILRLFKEKLEGIDPGFGIDLLLLEARRTGPMEAGSAPLSGDLAGAAIDDVALARLADRINARLGEGAVMLEQPQPRHPPDRATRLAPFAGKLPPPMPGPMPGQGPQAGPRPLRMLNRPERVEVISQVPDGPPLRFVWRRRAHRVVRADGPERIAPEWWTYLPPAGQTSAPLPRTRDYYRIEDTDGRRFWVFREGLYEDGRGGLPEWFVQGFFA